MIDRMNERMNKRLKYFVAEYREDSVSKYYLSQAPFYSSSCIHGQEARQYIPQSSWSQLDVTM